MFPAYSFPPRILTGLARDLVLSRRRSFHSDALTCIMQLQPPLWVFGEEHIPLAGPRVVTFNHYYRPGFNAIWMAVAIAALVPVEMHFVMTAELTYPGKWYAPLGRHLSKMLLRRAAQVYGFTSMPPMPPRPKDVQARADSVRRVLDIARRRQSAILGLAPEGSDQPGGRLTMPAPGVGRFALLLQAIGYQFIPAGIYEAGGTLCLGFGAAYELNLPRGISAHEKDERAARQVMTNIAPLLPAALRGEFQ